MNARYLILAVLALSAPARAEMTAARPLIPARDQAPLERVVEAALEKQTQIGTLRDFRVDWTASSLQCLDATSEMDPELDLGVCIVSAGAFQVEAKIAIIKRTTGYSVSVIYANVE